MIINTVKLQNLINNKRNESLQVIQAIDLFEKLGIFVTEQVKPVLVSSVPSTAIPINTLAASVGGVLRPIIAELQETLNKHKSGDSQSIEDFLKSKLKEVKHFLLHLDITKELEMICEVYTATHTERGSKAVLPILKKLDRSMPLYFAKHIEPLRLQVCLVLLKQLDFEPGFYKLMNQRKTPVLKQDVEQSILFTTTGFIDGSDNKFIERIQDILISELQAYKAAVAKKTNIEDDFDLDNALDVYSEELVDMEFLSDIKVKLIWEGIVT